MKKIYLLCFLFLIQFFLAQNSQLYFSGKFFNLKNKPQNFLKVQNKNTGISEMTDEEGFAILAAKVFDTLVWNNGKNTLVVAQYNLQELKRILERQHEKIPVENIYSKSYDGLIPKDSMDFYSISSSKISLTKNSNNYFSTVRKLKAKNDSLFKLKAQSRKSLVINGSFISSFDVKNRNAIPQTQNTFVQGRSENGALIWRGPETDELFSFGPNISSLAFDHQLYEYDLNGKLIPIANGNPPAKIYDNSIFKTVFSFNNQLNLNGIFKINNDERIRLTLDLGQQKNQMYFVDQFDIFNNFKSKLSSKIFNFDLNAAFSFTENKATNTNRIGLFNRVFQNSLLTPISFSNSQKIYLNSGNQRSYSQFADNPDFLFDQKNKYNFENDRKQYSFGLTRNWLGFRINFAQSFDEENVLNQDRYKPSTAGFLNGISNERIQKNQWYNSNVFGSYEFGGDLKNTFSFNHIFNDQAINIDQSFGKNYRYQRTSQDYIFSYNMAFHDYNDFDFGLDLGNSFYLSNTSPTKNYWLPKLNAFVTFENIFNWYRTKITFIGAFTQANSEPGISQSYSNYATTLLSAQNANQYFPFQEVESFKNLAPIDSREWKTGLKFNLGYRINLDAEYFKKKIANDIFPVFEGSVLKLKNLADHTYSGFDITLSYDNFYIGQDFKGTQKVSFFKYQDIVDRVDQGYNNLALSGFQDIYKTLAEGEVLGAIRGSYFERNASGQLIIDEFGYPKKANSLKIIADPTPDFVMKFTHQFSYKMLSLDMNWEWKKGGEIWNGTGAVLDYYGRSQNSGDQRNTKNYIFEGVNSTGNLNQIPVDFYNNNQDVSKNIWTRYGYLGVAENYVEKADYVRINSISLTANLNVEKFKRALGITLYVNNIVLWQAKSGSDPTQNFYDLGNGNGLDFFNLPSFKTFGCMVSFKF